MANPGDMRNLALFCDFENVALGVRDAQYDRFDIRRVLERLLLKGSIIIKKAYCDWSRYQEFKTGMHEASFELIEVPHVRQSGKNSADIRLVVDALECAYTKAQVDTFVIISGDSDFSPLVSKLRENGKIVIGVGVKNSSSELLIANCDEFIYYDDLVRDDIRRRAAPRRRASPRTPAADAPEVTPEPAPAAVRRGIAKGDKAEKAVDDERQQEAFDLLVETIEALASERGDNERIWGSMAKQALRRRKPGFTERYYGFGSFTALLDEAEKRGLIEQLRDEKSGGALVRVVQ
ncbi:MAG: NYN domain-containing protein [Kiritimatiellia bacterium]